MRLDLGREVPGAPPGRPQAPGHGGFRQRHGSDLNSDPVVVPADRCRMALHRARQAHARHGFVESFNGRLRDELLNKALFSTLGARFRRRSSPANKATTTTARTLASGT